MKNLKRRLATHPFLRGLRRQDLDLLAQGAQEISFEPGEIIFREQEPASRFYLIEEGEVGLDAYVPHDGYVMIQKIAAGQELGWSWLLAPFLWQFRARALERTRVICLDGAHALVSCERNHELGYELMKRVAQLVIECLQVTRYRLVEVGSTQSAPAVVVSRDRFSAPPALEVAIAQHPFLMGFPAAHLKTLTAHAMQSEFEGGEVIFKTGDPANRFYLIQHGRVALEAHSVRRTVLIQTLAEGDALGWSWLYEPYIWHLDARTLAPTTAIFFYGTPLRELCESDHDLGYELMKRITHLVIHRLQATRRQLLELQATSQILPAVL